MVQKKSKTTTKTATETKATTGTVVGLTPAAVRNGLKKAFESIETSYLKMCELLYEAKSKELYTKWGFETFRDYIDGELGMDYRKAQYLYTIWDKVKELNLPQDQVSRIGWSKMKDVVAVIDKKNAKKLLADAEKMSARELTEAVKISRRKDTKGADLPTITRMSVPMSEAEAATILDAIEQAKKAAETDNATVALEMICSDWLESQDAVPVKRDLTQLLEYAERMYNVDITYEVRETPPEEKVDFVEAEGEVEVTKAAEKANAKTKAAKAKPKAKAQEEETVDEESGADEDSGSDGENSGSDIDDLLGLG